MKRGMQPFWISPLLALALTIRAGSQVPQEKPPVDPLQALNASLGKLTTKVAPAVVHIRVTSYRSSAADHDEDDSKTQTLIKQHGSGSGVIVDSGGYIITALHLVEGERRIRVELDRRVFPKASAGQTEDHGYRSSFEAKLVGSFKEADLAVLKIDARNLPTLSFSDPDNLKQGQLVAALGSPEGLRNSLTLGVISSVAQQIEPDDPIAYIQTDAALASGSSGGPLVDVRGGIVGINVFSITDRGKDEGLGFAVPSAVVRFVYEQIRQYGSVPRAYLGMDIQGVTPTLASALHLQTDSGVIVAGVAPSSPAEKASVLAGDVLLTLDGTPLRGIPQLDWVLLHKRPGVHVVLEIARKSSKFVVNLPLVEGAPDFDGSLAAVDIEENSLDKLGVVGSAWKHGATEPHSRESTSGVLVTAKLSGTDMEPELVVGDVIRSVNGVSITSVAPLRAMLEGFKPGDAIALQVQRKGKLMYIVFEMD